MPPPPRVSSCYHLCYSNSEQPFHVKLKTLIGFVETHSSAEFAELLSGLIGDVAESEHRAVRVGLGMVMTAQELLWLPWFDVHP